tara:strand:- start:172 stop:315 length:144 start_codon:yes stop_codon:yes gene_type:complete
MKEIDAMLDQWIFNSLIRSSLRELIVKEMLYSSFDNNNKQKVCNCKK